VLAWSISAGGGDFEGVRELQRIEAIQHITPLSCASYFQI
jgi:hypothetical protein